MYTPSTSAKLASWLDFFALFCCYAKEQVVIKKRSGEYGSFSYSTYRGVVKGANDVANEAHKGGKKIDS